MKYTWLEELNPEQRKIVESVDGPMLVLAGAGSGKTRCIVSRVAYLIEEMKISPERILLLTFTNKAAGEMKERVKKLVGHELPWAGTFHSVCARILRKEGINIGINPGYVIYDEADQLSNVKTAIEKLELSPREFKPRPVLNTISGLKNELVSALEYPQIARGVWQEGVARIYLQYQRQMLENQALDFDDLLMRTVELFEKKVEILNKYSNQWQYILIDEYQDTNQSQFVLTKQLASKWRNLCCVGDFAQSIYAWRGADFRNLEKLKDEYKDLKIFNLEQNYRSTQTILDAASGLISNNTTHPVLRLWTDKQGGRKVSLYEAYDEKDEAKFIISNLGNNLSDYAILYRTNAQSRAVEEALIEKGISYVLVGGVRFYQRREIKDCLAYLKVIANEKDKVSWDRIEKLGKRRMEKFKKYLKSLNSVKRKGPTLTLLDGILKATGYITKYDPKDEEDLGRLENIKELRSVARELESLDQFLENVALIENEHMPRQKLASSHLDGQADNKVTLMTLHAAKGLEFKTVFMVGMEEGLFPHSRSMLERDELEEERRLAYVGMTRAKHSLILTYTRRRMYFGRRQHSSVSRFIGEIPEELLEKREW